MTYRSDHEAALDRVDALEHELEVLSLAYERRRSADEAAAPVAKPRSRWLVSVLAATAVLAAVGLGTGIVHAVRTSVDEPAVVAIPDPVAIPAPPAIDPVAELRACRLAIAPSAHLDAASTDPHRIQSVGIRSIMATAAGCREQLSTASQRLATSPAVLARVAAWSAAEDELVGSITRTVIYYESDPYALDGYRSAPQLWREYDAAITARDAVLVDLAPVL